MTSSTKTTHFRQWVFWTGIFQVVAFGALVCPFTSKIFLSSLSALNKTIGLGGAAFVFPSNVHNFLMIYSLGVSAIVFGIFLIIASFDIENRAWFVFWDALGRVIFFLICIYFAFFKNASQMLFVGGSLDLFLGSVLLYYIFTIKGLKIV